MGQGKVCISCNYSCTISFLVKILLVNLKYLYIQYAWTSIIKKQNRNQNVKVEKMVVLVKTFDHYYHKFELFQLPCKVVKEFETEIKSKFNHGFTNHGYLHSAVWKSLYNFKIRRAQETRDNQFLFQIVQNNEIFEIFKMLKNNSITFTRLTFTTVWTEISH